MPLVNPTDFPIIAATTSGTDLADRLNRLFDAYESNQFSPTRPLQLQKGGLWTRAEQNGDLTLLFYDGANDHEIGVVSAGGTSLFGGGKPLALEFDITHDYKKDEIIYDKVTKTYYVAKAAVPKGQPWNVGEWTLLTNVFNEIHQSQGGGKCHVGALPPPLPHEDGMMWYDVTDPAKPVFKVYHDGVWDNRGFAAPSSYDVNFLCIAGGGGGGYAGTVPPSPGGGGAGGFREDVAVFKPGIVYDVIVGAGGGQGADGGNSQIVGISLTNGGGGGGNSNDPTTPGRAGGSGGGAGARQSVFGVAVVGQGHDGGAGGFSSGGGGGGAGGPGATGGSSSTNGTGGAGKVAAMDGIVYAGGGGSGGGINTDGPAAGGGGGAHGWADGLPNTGAGGSGGGNTHIPGGGGWPTGKSGGSGIVKLKIPTAVFSGVTTGNPTITQVGTDTFIAFTSSGTITG